MKALLNERVAKGVAFDPHDFISETQTFEIHMNHMYIVHTSLCLNDMDPFLILCNLMSPFLEWAYMLFFYRAALKSYLF